jgi:hypothetical protein
MPVMRQSPTPYARSLFAKFLHKRLEQLKHSRTEQEIADEALLHEVEHLTSLRRGDERLPLVFIPWLARAVRANPLHVFRLVVDQHWPGLEQEFLKWAGTITTANEEAILLRKWRAATDNMDPRSTEEVDRAVDQMIEVVRSVELPL